MLLKLSLFASAANALAASCEMQNCAPTLVLTNPPRLLLLLRCVLPVNSLNDCVLPLLLPLHAVDALAPMAPNSADVSVQSSRDLMPSIAVSSGRGITHPTSGPGAGDDPGAVPARGAVLPGAGLLLPVAVLPGAGDVAAGVPVGEVPEALLPDAGLLVTPVEMPGVGLPTGAGLLVILPPGSLLGAGELLLLTACACAA